VDGLWYVGRSFDVKHFQDELAARQTDPAGRRWLFVPYDPLTDAVGPLSREGPAELGIVVVENRRKARRRPYHHQKLALVLSNLRHFALEQAERGVTVHHVVGDAPYTRLLEPVVAELGPLRVMRPAERELRSDLEPLVQKNRIELVESDFAEHPGRLEPRALVATAKDAERAWRWAQRHCLEHFGPYEDATSRHSKTLFHTQISPLMNLHRLLPARVLPDACPAGLRAEEPLPPAFWGTPSGLGCLDAVVSDVWATGYGHHITRLMVLSNLATLLGISPREIADWFWVAYTDAYDWVVEPNVLGMGTFGLGDLFTTKPYVSGAAYINKMSDYCGECSFSPKQDCPITPLYWAFLDRNEAALRDNPRLAMPLRSLARRPARRREHDRRVHDWVRGSLQEGERLCPEQRPPERRWSRGARDRERGLLRGI
jgi:deoxyribodipyrimidine photolyase-like uncharacterized protein